MYRLRFVTQSAKVVDLWYGSSLADCKAMCGMMTMIAAAGIRFSLVRFPIALNTLLAIA